MTTTKTTTSVRGADPLESESLAGRFKAWRATRRRGERTPKDLWQAAADLARLHGLNPTVAGR